jgi:hypothetical protein
MSGLSNRIGFGSIRFSNDKVQKPSFQYNLILIQYRFDSKTIRYKTRLSSYEKNWPFGSWPIFKGIVHQDGKNI